MPSHCSKRVRRCPEYHLVQYYRSIRNRIIHRTKANTDEILKRLLKHETHFRDYYKLVPNKFGSLAFSDFQLLTRSMGYFAKVLNDACDLQPADILRFEESKEAFVEAALRSKGALGKI